MRCCHLHSRGCHRVPPLTRRCVPWRITRNAILLLGGALTHEACLPWRTRPGHVVMDGRLRASNLLVTDTLRILRTIRNTGRRPISVTWGGTDVSFTVRDSLGRQACRYTDASTLVEVGATVQPGDTLARNVAWPLRRLSECGPGRYTVDASLWYFPRRRGEGKAVKLTLDGLRFTVRDTSGR